MFSPNRIHNASRSLPFRLLLWALVPVQGCLGEIENVTLHFDAPPGVEPRAATVVLLPFDLNQLIDSVTHAAGSPRPAFPNLEQELRDSRPEIPAALDALEAEWRIRRSRVIQLADSLASLQRTEPGYPEAYDRLRAMYAELTARELDLERRLRALLSTNQVQTAQRAALSSDSLRRWEEHAMTELPNAMDSVVLRSGRHPQIIQGPEASAIRARLSPGRWWAVIRLPHPENTFLEYYWNVPFTVNRLVPVVVPIGEHNLVVQWRH